MDLYFVKFRVISKLTSEVVQGYLLGKMNQAPEYDFFVVPGRYVRTYFLDLKEGFENFLTQFEKHKSQALKEIAEASLLTDQFSDYLSVQMRKRNPKLVGNELFRFVEERDVEVLKAYLAELLSEWAEKMEIEVVADPLRFEDVSIEVVKEHFEFLSSEEIFKLLQREDIRDIPEIFPVLDPLNGKNIKDINVEETLDFVILNYGNKDQSDVFKRFLREKFGTENVMSLPGKIVSKEVVKTKNGTFYLVKVEFDEGVYGKALISPNLKIKYGEHRVITSEENWMSKLGEILEKEAKPSQTLKKRSLEAQVASYQHTVDRTDIFLAIALALLVMGILLVLSYLIFS